MSETSDKRQHTPSGGGPIALAVIASVACCLVEMPQTYGIVAYYRDALSGSAFACWLAGLVAATISPPCATLLAWSISDHRRGWIVHVLFVPLPYALVQASARPTSRTTIR